MAEKTKKPEVKVEKSDGSANVTVSGPLPGFGTGFMFEKVEKPKDKVIHVEKTEKIIPNVRAQKAPERGLSDLTREIGAGISGEDLKVRRGKLEDAMSSQHIGSADKIAIREAFKKDPTADIDTLINQGQENWHIKGKQMEAEEKRKDREARLAETRLTQSALTRRQKLAEKSTADATSTAYGRQLPKDIAGATFKGAEDVGGAATQLALAAMREPAGMKGGGGYSQYGALPLTTPEVNPFVVPHPDESFIAYGTKQLEMAGTNSFTAYGGENIMQATYAPKKGMFEQIGSDTIMRGSGGGGGGMTFLEGLGEKEIEDRTNVMPDMGADAGSQLSETGSKVMGTTSAMSSIMELGEKRQSEAMSTGKGALVDAPAEGLAATGRRVMDEHANLCNACKKKVEYKEVQD